MSSSPETLARMLLSYYASQGTSQPMIVNLVTEDPDNEYLTEVLTSIYLECHKIFTTGQMGPSVSQEKYAECLNHVFISVGYILKTEIVSRSKLSELVYFARITNNHAQLNQFHPFRIREGIIKIQQEEGLVCSIPESLNMFYNNQDMLPNIIIVHDLEPSNDSVMLLKFQKANIHFQNEQGDEVITEEMVGYAMSALQDMVSDGRSNELGLNDIDLNGDSNNDESESDDDDDDDDDESDTEQ